MKKILAIGAIAATGLFFFVKDKAAHISKTLKELIVKVVAITDVKLNTGNGSVDFNTSVSIHNPSSTDLNIDTAGLISINRIIYKNLHGQTIGESYPDITNVSIPKGQTLQLDKIPTSIPIGIIGSALNTLLTTLNDPNALVISAEIKTPTGTYII